GINRFDSFFYPANSFLNFLYASSSYTCSLTFFYIFYMSLVIVFFFFFSEDSPAFLPFFFGIEGVFRRKLLN
ncbi:hypothetical protein AKJ65_02265, partial [candidate division MSBL1 archaeon SCGC-AAA259E19]